VAWKTVVRLAAMDCSAEERLVRMHLAGRPDVHRVSVDLDARTVTVTHDATTEHLLGWLNELDLGSSLVSDRHVPAPTGVSTDETRPQRAALVLALVINAGFFVAELTTGVISGSMGLVADSLDMLADAGVYALSLIAVGQAVARQKRLAAASGYLQLGLAVVGLAEVIRRGATGEPPPDVPTMIIVSVLALLANVVVLVVLQRERGEAAHLQAAWIFTSNDIKVNILVIVAALLVTATGSAAPDLVVGALIFLVVANGARRILRLAR
jgi:Co/Zn/Cd efflux system component